MLVDVGEGVNEKKKGVNEIKKGVNEIKKGVNEIKKGVNKIKKGVVALNINSEPLRTRSGWEAAQGCEPCTYQQLDKMARHV